MKKYSPIYTLLSMLVFCTSYGQTQTEEDKLFIDSETKAVVAYHGPKAITRNIIQDKKGNIWIAAFDGIFQYNGKSFINATSKVSSARFFSVLEDRRGGLWFGTIGSGVYYYDGITFKNFTTSDGLLNNEVGSIYEDKKGNIWFGVSGGASCYDGKSFRNYIIDGNDMNEDRTGKTFSDRRPYEINSIIEDKKGKLWFATRGNTFVYDGKTFSSVTHNDEPFKNVRSIIEDKKGNIWLGGADGLWRYDGNNFTIFNNNFVGYIHEDKKGNILTSSEGVRGEKDWGLSRYNQNSLSNKIDMVPEVLKANEGMIFGILEANDGSIWFGTLNGVSRYIGIPNRF